MEYDVEYHRSTENNTYCTYPSTGCGVYAAVSGTFQTPNGNYSGTVTEDSSIKEYLNNTYYPTLNGIAKTQVQSHTFNIGNVQILDESGNDSIEKNIAGEKMYQWIGNVGLINVSDVLKASTNTACTSATDQLNKLMQETPEITCDSNYLLDTLPDLTGYWTINAFSAESDDDSDYAWGAARETGLAGLGCNNASTDNASGARPVVFLKSSIQITRGDGSKSNPYIIQ